MSSLTIMPSDSCSCLHLVVHLPHHFLMFACCSSITCIELDSFICCMLICLGMDLCCWQPLRLFFCLLFNMRNFFKSYVQAMKIYIHSMCHCLAKLQITSLFLGFFLFLCLSSSIYNTPTRSILIVGRSLLSSIESTFDWNLCGRKSKILSTGSSSYVTWYKSDISAVKEPWMKIRK